MAGSKRLPWWGKLLIVLLSIVIFLGLVFGGACIFVKVKYDVSVFETISQIKTLNKQVNVSEKYAEVYTSSDMTEAKDAINDSFTPVDLITYDETNGYAVNDSMITLMTADVKLTEKQTGALMAMLLDANDKTSVTISGEEVPFSLVAISFDNITTSTLDFNVVIKLDITGLKAKMNSFPLSWVKKYVPDKMYLSSVIAITKGDTAFSYTLASKSLTINNLSESQTASLFKTINTFVDVGSLDKINLDFGGAFCDALLGNSESDGFAYTLSKAPIFAHDFAFVTIDNVEYFIVYKPSI